MNKNNLPEILAPAGGMDAVFAAVRNGADAVYLGMERFSARQGAQNFDETALYQAVRYCHLHGVFVYLAVNTILFDPEVPALLKTLECACGAGVDAVIVQDMGTLAIVKRCCPDMPVHASTQMTVHTRRGALLLKELGAARVVLAREMNREEIREITRNVDIETEVFVHGALCMSVSGQCYMSALIGTRSGNKGSCAGTCRLPFSADGGKQGGKDAGVCGHALSLRDNCLAGQFDALCRLGVTSLKIEGRMKRPEYAAAAVGAYAGLKAGQTPDLDTLRAVFSRGGFTDGYFTGETGGGMFGIREKEDVLSASGEVLARLRETYRKETVCHPLAMHFTAAADKNANLIVTTKEKSVNVNGPIPEPARNRPMDRDFVTGALGRLGGTAFRAKEIQTEIGPGLAMPKSALNEMRRKAVQAMEETLSAPVPVRFTKRLPALPGEKKRAAKQMLRARFRSAEQIPWELAERLSAICLPWQEVRENSEKLVKIREKVILEPDRVMFGTEQECYDGLSALVKRGFRRLWCSNPAHIGIGRALGMSLHGSMFLNVTNSYSLEAYQRLSLSGTELSFEMAKKDILRLRADMPVGIAAYGYLPAMIVRNCPLRQGRSCTQCPGHGTLTDRRGARFPVVCRERRYAEVLNCRPLVLSDRLAEFDTADWALLYFTLESQSRCGEIIGDFLAGRKPAGDFTRGLYYRGVR